MRAKLKKAIPRACVEGRSALIPFLRLPYPPSSYQKTPKHGHQHLFTYLSFRAGAGEVPDQVTPDITGFVTKKQITEKMFLTLNEGDLDRYVFFLFLVLLFLFFNFVST